MLSIRSFKLIALVIAALFCSTAASVELKADESPQWGLVRLSVVSMRAKASHASEQVSQALMGTPVTIIDNDGDWSLVRTPDGYKGYIINHSLAMKTEQEMAEWRTSPRVMVCGPDEIRAVAPDGSPASDLVSGCILEVGDANTLITPDGRRLRALPAGVVAPLAQICARSFNPDALPEIAAHYIGVPYLWGGMSSKGMDCSGLVRMAYAAQGRIVGRDARDQAVEGTPVETTDLQPGDLIFFGNPKTGRITHVAIYERNGIYVHSSQMVKRNSIKPDSDLYLPLHILGCRRINGTPLTRLKEYF